MPGCQDVLMFEVHLFWLLTYIYIYCIYTLSPHNHGSSKRLHLKGDKCWREPFLTSMVLGGRVSRNLLATHYTLSNYRCISKTWWICVLLTGSHPTPASPRSDEAAPSNVSSRPQNSGWICLRSKALEAFFFLAGGVIFIVYRPYRHIYAHIGLNSGTNKLANALDVLWYLWCFSLDIVRIVPPVFSAKDSSWGGSFHLPTFSPACVLRHGHTDPIKKMHRDVSPN